MAVESRVRTPPTLWAWLGLLLCMRASTSVATTFPPPVREFSTAERFEFAISASDAAILCRIDAYVDTLVPQPGGDSDQRNMFLQVLPQRWLMGEPAGTASPLKIALIASFRSELREVARSHPGLEALLFLRRYPSSFWSFRATSDFVLNQHPDFPGAGIVFLSPENRDQVLTEVERGLHRQTIDSLVARANLGIVGRARGTQYCDPVGVNVTCYTVSVDKVLFGEPGGKSVNVYCLARYVSEKPTLLLLSRDAHGVYCPVGVLGGLIPLDKARIEGRRVSGGDAIIAVRKAAGRMGK